MGLSQLCTQIEQNSKVRAASVLKEAKQDAKRIVVAAQKSASDSVAQAVEQAKEFSSLEAKERLTAAQLEASKLISDAKDEAVHQCLEQVWEKYSQSTKSAQYKKKLREWARKALDELSIPGAVICSNSSDRSTLSSAGFKLGDSIECTGGVRAQSKNGKIMVDYTLESQFESKKEELQKRIYSSLFSDYVFEAKSSSKSKNSIKKRSGKKKKR